MLYDITKVYRSDGNAVTALDSVSVDLPLQGFTAIAGSNGSGKTTLLNIAAGETMPDKGKVVFQGKNITTNPDFKRNFLGRVYQNAYDGICADLTIEENLSIAQVGTHPRFWRLGITKDRRKKILQVMQAISETMDLDIRLDEKIGNLSGGQMQVIAICFLMLRSPKPKLILADEPTSNLDPDNAFRCIDLLENLAKDSGVVMVSHDARALAVADRLLIMHKGKIIAKFEGEDLYHVDLMEVIRKNDPLVR